MGEMNTIIIFATLMNTIIAFIALIKQSKFNKVQKNLSELQTRVYNLELETRKKADISAMFMKEGNTAKVKIFNQGNALAKNIRIRVQDDTIILQDELSKFPYPVLDVGGQIFLVAVIYLNTIKSIETIEIWWDDEFQFNNHKEVTINF